MSYLTFALCNHFQLYVAAVSPARDEKATYVAWGHSTVINPWYVLTCNLPVVKTVLLFEGKAQKCTSVQGQHKDQTQLQKMEIRHLQSVDIAFLN